MNRCLVIFFLAASAVSARSDTIRVKQGELTGKSGRDRSINVFLGIPYAAPPVGPLRWRAPQPAAPWREVRQATQYSPTCMQPERPHDSVYYPGFEPMSEDCLYLNVWTPAKSPADRLAVMVFIHGGGFRVNSGSEKFFDGEALARQGVVLVTLNYRLGIFGFFSHPELSKESDRHASGNYGLADQIAALRWVRENIAAFGGDPQRVTVFGQSAGANSVCFLLVSPLSKGLYARAIGESVVDCLAPADEEITLSAAESAGSTFAKTVKGGSLTDLRTMPAADLLKASEQGAYRPIIDGEILPESPYAIFMPKQQNVVDLLVGSNGDEGTLLGARSPGKADLFIQEAKQKYGVLSGAFLKLFPADTDAQSRDSNNAMWRDQVASQGRMLARQMSGAGKVKAYQYYFSHKPPVPRGMFREQASQEIGAYHSSELEYVFHNLETRPYEWSDTDRKLADAISAYWVNFAKTGNPNGKGLPQWPAADAKHDVVMEFAEQPMPHSGIDKAALDFFESRLAAQHPGN